jgi:arsenate reductase
LVQLLNTRGPAFKKLELKADQLDDQQAMELMMGNPRLMKRPVLLRENKVILGFKEEEYDKFFS